MVHSLGWLSCMFNVDHSIISSRSFTSYICSHQVEWLQQMWQVKLVFHDPTQFINLGPSYVYFH